MKKTIISIGLSVLIGMGMVAFADQPDSGHTTEVIPGDWDDDDPTLNFQFNDIPVASFNSLHLTLTCQLPESSILYTMDPEAKPSDPEAWTVYTQPIALTEDCTVRFFGRHEGYKDSDIQEFIFVYSDYQSAAPAIAPDLEKKNLVMVTETPDAEIRYTTDGSDPDKSSTLYTAPVAIEANGTYRARSFAPDLFDSAITEYKVDFLTSATPTAIFDNKKLQLTADDSNVSIWYTTDVNALISDEDSWTLYTAPVSLTEDCTVCYFGRRNGYHDSEVQNFVFSYAAYQVMAPQLSTNPEGTHVMMVCDTENAEIRYTTDGSEPTQQSSLYTAPVEILSNGTFKARAFRNDLFDSNVIEFSIMHMAVPVPSAEFVNRQLILSCPDEQAQIMYTTDSQDGVSEEDLWNVYSGPISLTGDCTVRFFARRENFCDSDIQSFNFVYSAFQAADPTIERDAQGTHIVMETATPGGVIHYTDDGSEPNADSPVYTAPILIERNTTFSAFTIAEGLFDSKVNRYVVSDITVPVPAAEFTNRHLILSCPDSKAQIWYTFDDNATPDDMEGWTLYSEPVALTHDCMVHFFSERQGLNHSDIETFVFILANYQVAPPAIVRTDDERSIMMVCETSNAEIRYTTDGSEPTEESELYTEPIFITMNCTFKAKAFADGLFNSPVSEYTVSNMIVMAPHATFENKKVVLSVWDELAAVWYSTEKGASVEDADAWTLYTSPLDLTEDCTISFFARRGGFIDSHVVTFDFIFSEHQTATPVIEYNETDNIILITCDTENAVIRYTTDGSEPDDESDIYNGPIAVDHSMTVRCRAFSDELFDSKETELFVPGPSSVDKVYTNDIHIAVENSELVIYSNQITTLPVYDLNGRYIRTLNVTNGRNEITELAKGIYIIGNVKVKY